jgi:hypothetical protein
MTNPPSCGISCSSTFADIISRKCVNICPISFFAYSINLTCLSQCPFGYYGDPSTKTCVLTCPTINPYGDDTTHLCVKNCPSIPNLFGFMTQGQTLGGLCVSVCPDGYYSNNYTRTCVILCPIGTFG